MWVERVSFALAMSISRQPCFLALLALCYGASLSIAAVVSDFNQVERCKDSLYMGTPPRGIVGTHLKRICQHYADRPRYVTVYDPLKRIPIYSAYTFKKTEASRRLDFPWMYEPQVRRHRLRSFIHNIRVIL